LKTLESGGKLPNIVVIENTDGVGYFYNIVPNDLTPHEEQEYIQFQQLNLLKSIKNYLRFFMILTIFGLVIGLIWGFIVITM